MFWVLSGVLCGIILSGLIVYACFASFWRGEADGHQRVRFRELKALIKVAPKNWRPDSVGSEYMVYVPTHENIYMYSYFDTLRLSRMIKKIRKHEAQQSYNWERIALLNHFRSDVESDKKEVNDALITMYKDAGEMVCKYCTDKWGCNNDVSLPARKCTFRKLFKGSK